MNELILVVDDEPEIRRVVSAYLEQASYRIIQAADGSSAVGLFRSKHPDFVILDLNLPGLDGLDVCRAIRKESEAPILMLTARVEEADKLIGLELGADDYMVKPFSPRELVARVKTILRRAEVRPEKGDVFRAATLVVDVPGRKVTQGTKEVDLTPSEFQILVALMRHPGRVLTRMQLLDTIHDVAIEAYERVVDAHIKNLRKKIEPDPNSPIYVITVFGVGYKFAETE